MTSTNSANFYDPTLGFTDPTTFLTPVGSFAATTGPYGTYDMGGDVSEWTQGVRPNPAVYRVIRGQDYAGTVIGLASTSFADIPPSTQDIGVGFRVAEVPEPSSMVVLTIGAVGLLARNRRR